MTEECKKEILEYVESQGWFDNTDIIDISINFLDPSYFYQSKKGRGRSDRILHVWSSDYEKMDKYLLEFIGHILKKHNIKKMTVHGDYQSNDWTFNTIKKI